VLKAIGNGIPVLGICLYPICNHPGWVDDRHCHNGLYDYPDGNGHRDAYRPLLGAIRERLPALQAAHAGAFMQNRSSAGIP
jgi:hypothetical protein